MLRIIPTPAYTQEREGAFSFSGACAFIDCCADDRVKTALGELCREAGISISASCEAPSCKAIAVSHGNGGDGYRLTVSEDGIVIDGDGPSGAFYGIQSLRQLVRENGKSIPCCYVDDRPDFPVRGFYHDVTRGRVPTLKKLKEIADYLAFYKINHLQLYVEDAFTFRELEGIATEENALTPYEILELDAYCKERFIDLVPSMATFGHLFTLLQSERYNHICELEGHEPYRNYWLEKQWHHTVDVYAPDTIKVIGSMLEQYIPLFSSKYFNICCDETMDLCMGKNLGRDKGEAYFHHVEKLIHIVKSHGKIPMIWGDECMARPDMAKERLDEDVIVLNWCYRHTVAEWIPRVFRERGFSQICCTGTSCWENFIENVHISTGNISSFAAHAKRYGALGILNTNWGDFGHVCPFNCNLYGLLFGAEKSWNVDAKTDGEFEAAASLLLYGVTEFNMIDSLKALSLASGSCSWSDFVVWHSATHLEEKDAELGYGWGPHGKFTEADVIKNVQICTDEAKRLSAMGKNDIAEDLILSARALALMNRLVLYVNGAKGYGDTAALQADFDLWLEDYSRAWLRDDKPSGLWRVQEFIEKITL